jgi:hypothetical protein
MITNQILKIKSFFQFFPNQIQIRQIADRPSSAPSQVGVHDEIRRMD